MNLPLHEKMTRLERWSFERLIGPLGNLARRILSIENDLVNGKYQEPNVRLGAPFSPFWFNEGQHLFVKALRVRLSVPHKMTIMNGNKLLAERRMPGNASLMCLPDEICRYPYAIVTIVPWCDDDNGGHQMPAEALRSIDVLTKRPCEICETIWALNSFRVSDYANMPYSLVFKDIRLGDCLLAAIAVEDRKLQSAPFPERIAKGRKRMSKIKNKKLLLRNLFIMKANLQYPEPAEIDLSHPDIPFDSV